MNKREIETPKYQQRLGLEPQQRLNPASQTIANTKQLSGCFFTLQQTSLPQHLKCQLMFRQARA